jgi:hypothetical protein
MNCPECGKPMSPYTNTETGKVDWCCPDCGIEIAGRRMPKALLCILLIMAVVGALCVIFVPVHAQPAPPIPPQPYVYRLDRYGVEIHWINDDPNVVGSGGVARVLYPDGSWIGVVLDWCGWFQYPGVPKTATWCNTSKFYLDGTGRYSVIDGWVADGVPIAWLPTTKFLWQYQLAAPAVLK